MSLSIGSFFGFFEPKRVEVQLTGDDKKNVEERLNSITEVSERAKELLKYLTGK